MVLRPKTWESRSPPGLLSAKIQAHTTKTTRTHSPQSLNQHPRAGWRRPLPQSGDKQNRPGGEPATARTKPDNAGWSSPVARQAHNLKVTGSNPVPATKNNPVITKRWRGFSVRERSGDAEPCPAGGRV